ncbi:MAG: DUF2953 domain-containing protein [Lachnospiraceae bacterium]|nr:DUF2953 domain-containing protein [Lachnospiraceae bacterium]
MTVVTILLLILKIILILLAVLLGLVILLLVVPVFYKMEGSAVKNEEMIVNGWGKVRILLGILTVHIRFPEEIPVRVTFLGITVFRLRPQEKKPEEPPASTEEKPQENKVAVPLKDRIKAVIHILQMDASKEALRRGKEKIFRILGHVLPRKMEGRIAFGMEDPADTGYILGGASVLFSFLNWKMQLLPDFEQEKLDVYAKGKGHIVFIVLILYVLQILTDRYIRGFIRRLKKGIKYGR